MNTTHEAIIARLNEHGVPYRVHEHTEARTVEDAVQRLPFPVEQYLKTVAFRLKDGRAVLAALRARDRIDYRGLAEALGVKRADIRQFSPPEVQAELGLEAGTVSPVPTRVDTLVVVDEAATEMDTVYTGIGRPDRTLEIRLSDLLDVTGATVKAVGSRQ